MSRGRAKRPVILRKENYEHTFESIADAAKFLGVRSPALSQCLKHRQRHNKICGFTAEYACEPEPKLKESGERKVPTKQYKVEIDGVRFISKECPDKTSCKECDIFKMRPPLNMAMCPLCYDYSCGNRKIYQICQSYKVIWERQI